MLLSMKRNIMYHTPFYYTAKKGNMLQHGPILTSSFFCQMIIALTESLFLHLM